MLAGFVPVAGFFAGEVLAAGDFSFGAASVMAGADFSVGEAAAGFVDVSDSVFGSVFGGVADGDCDCD